MNRKIMGSRFRYEAAVCGLRGALKATPVIIFLLLSASLAFGQGAAPSPPFTGWWDARSSGVKPNDSTTDQTNAFQLAWRRAVAIKRALFIPAGVYNAGLVLDSTADGLTIILGGDVEIKQAWHFTGNGPDIAPSDANYNASTNYASGVTVSGGRLVLGNGGRLGTFYVDGLSFLSPVWGRVNGRGVHIYSHTINSDFGDIIIDGTQADAAITGGVWLDPYAGATTSQPRNVTIKNIKVKSAFYNGVYIDAKDVTIGSIDVDSSGLAGVRVASYSSGYPCERIKIGNVYANKSGWHASVSTEHLLSGLSIDDFARDVTIDRAFIRNAKERGILIRNGATRVTIGDAHVDSCGTESSDQSYQVFVGMTSSPTEATKPSLVKFGNLYITAPMVVSSQVGLGVSYAKDVSVDKLEVNGAFKQSLLVNNESKRFTASTVIIRNAATVSGAGAVQLGGTGTLNYDINSILIDSCGGYGVFITGTPDSSSIRIGSIIANGDGTANNYSGVYLDNVAGYLELGFVRVFNYDASGTNGRGFQVGGTNTGKIHVGTLEAFNNSYGIYWNNTNNDGFTFDHIKVPLSSDTKKNTNDYSTSSGVNFLSDIRTRVTRVSSLRDTMMFAGYPVKQSSAPLTDAILKFNTTADSNWYFGTDAGATAGDNVQVDFGAGTVDVSNPVFKEGSGIDMTQSGSDVTIAATSTFGNMNKIYDGTTYNTTNGAVVAKQGGGVKLTWIDDVDGDSMYVTGRFNSNVMDTSNANGNTQGNLTVKSQGVDSTHIKNAGIDPGDIDNAKVTWDFNGANVDSLQSAVARVGIVKGTTAGSVNNLFLDSVNIFKGLSAIVADSIVPSLGLVRTTASDTAEARWHKITGTYAGVSRVVGSNDTTLAVLDSGTVTLIRPQSNSLKLQSSSGLEFKGASGGNIDLKSPVNMQSGFVLHDTATDIKVFFQKPDAGTDTTDYDGYVWKFKNVAGTKNDSATLQADNNSGGGGGGTLGGLVVVDTNQNGITTVNPDSIYLHGAGGIGYRFVTGATKDSLAIRVRADGTYLDTSGTQGALEIKANSLDSTKIGANSILLAEMADNAIGNAEMRDDAITAVEIATGAVTTDEILNATILSADIADTVAGSGITGAKISRDGITSTHILDGTILTADLADSNATGGGITGAKIDQNVITTDHIATDGVGADEIATDAVGTAEIATDAVGSAEIAAGAVGASEIATDAVFDAEIASGAVRGAEIDSTQTNFKMRSLIVGDTILAGLGLGVRMKQTGTNTPVTVYMPRVIDTANTNYILKYTNVAGTASDSFSWAADATGGGGGSGGTKIRYFDDGTLEYNTSDTIDVRVGGGIGFTYDATPTYDSVRIWVDVDGTTLDTNAHASGDPGKVKVKDGGIGATQLADGSVVGGTGGDIQDGTITAADLATGSLTAGDMAASAVAGGTAGTIEDATITNADIADDNLDATSLAPNAVANSEMADNAIGQGELRDSCVSGTEMLYRRVAIGLTQVHVRPNYATTDSLTVSLNEVGNTTALSFDEYLFYDSTNKASQPDDSVYVIGVIPEDILADSLYINYKTNNATYASTGGLQDIQWFYTTGDIQQPGSGTATGSSNAVNLASTSWATSKTNLAGVTLVAGTRFKVRLIMDFTADNEVVRIGSVTVIGRKR